MKTKIFIDFDGTIYDTNKLRKEFYSLLESLGFNEADIVSAYKDECRDNFFTAEGMLRRLHQIKNFDFDEIVQKERAIHDKNPSFLYEDTINFLKNIDREKYEVNLITLGNFEFQKFKVEKSEIKQYFDNIYYANVEKWEYLDNIVRRDEKFIIIDDREDTIYYIQHKYKNARAFKIVRGDVDKDDPAVNEVRDDVSRIYSLEEAVSNV